MKKLTRLIIGLSVLTMLMVCMTAVSFADTAQVKVTVGASSIAKENCFDFVTQELTVSGDASEKYGLDDTKTSDVVTFIDVLCTVCEKKYGTEFTKETAANYIAYGETGYFSKWFGVETYNVGYAFNRDFSMSGSGFDEITDGSTIDILGMTSYSEPLTYFDYDAVTVSKGEAVTLQLSGSSYGMTNAAIKPAEGKEVKAAMVNEDGSLTNIEGAVLDADGKITVSFDKEGTYLVSAYGEAMSKDYNGEDAVARIGLPLVKIIVEVPEIEVNFAAGAPGEFDEMFDGLTVKGDMFEKAFPDQAENDAKGAVSFADAIVAAHMDKYDISIDKVNEYFSMSGKDWLAKQFGHEYTGMLYINNKAIPNGANTDTIKDGDVLFSGSYADGNYADVFGYFNKTDISTTIGKKVTLKLTTGNSLGGDWAQMLPLDEAKLMLINNEGKLEDVPSSIVANYTKGETDGTFDVTFKKAGIYLISVEGSVAYEGYNGPVTGRCAGPNAVVVVNKAANPMTAKAKTVKASSKKKMTFTAKKAFSVSKAQGKVTYKQATKNKKIAVSSAGKVTVKKGLKKGKTYSIKVKVTAAGNANYKKGTKTVTLKVKVTK